MTLVNFQAKNHPQQTRYSGSNRGVDDRALPQEVYNELIGDRFHPTVDVAASKANRKCARYYTEEDDALTYSWWGERVYCNPPYSNIEPWVRKAWKERAAETIVMLLPANRTEQNWWQVFIEKLRDREGSPLKVEFLRSRLRFLKPGQDRVGPNERPPFGCCLCIWDRSRHLNSASPRLSVSSSNFSLPTSHF